MWLDLLLLCVTVAVFAWGLDERNRRIKSEAQLESERSLSETLGRMNGQLRTHLEEAQWRLNEVGGMGSPGPRSERRRRRT